MNALKRLICAILWIAASAANVFSQTSQPTSQPWTVQQRWVKAEEDFLASDALQGRGSGTRDELLAATYIGSKLEEFGVEPLGSEKGSYVQTVNLSQSTLSGPPKLIFGQTTLTHGQGFDLLRTNGTPVSGPLQKLNASDTKVKPGAVVLLAASGDFRQIFAQAVKLGASGAKAVIVETPAGLAQRLDATNHALPRLQAQIEGVNPSEDERVTFGGVSAENFQKLSATPEGAEVRIDVQTGDKQVSHTYNAVGVIHGSDPQASQDAILLTAHLDHLGVGRAVDGDDIYNGADDDASGCVAVLELARALASGQKPKRTILFAFFGSEEKGGYGAVYFREHPPVPLEHIAANLEFEMIGRPDAMVAPDQLWLTGWERSNLGTELAKQGAKLVADPHPKEQFFMRSDNYALARKGVVAQTVSSFGLHSQYHQPNDDLAHLDLEHMTNAIQSMVEPVRWLANSGFKPQWTGEGKP